MTPRRAAATSAAAVAGVLAAVGLLLVVALWAASIGPDRALRGPGLERVTPTATPTEEPSASGSPGIDDTQRIREHPGEANPFLKALAALVEIALAIAFLWLLTRVGRRAWAAWRDRLRAPARPAYVEFDVLEEPEQAREQVEREAREALALIREGEPRNAIVATWDRFETAADGLGLGRRPWETSSEFVLRMLAVVEADHGAVMRLEGLYREARYSSHALGEDDRDEAYEALLEIQASLLSRRVRR